MSKIPDWYSAVGDGWTAILTILHTELMQVCPEYEIAQLKEKLGGLRAYLDLENVPQSERQAAYDLEHKYEQLSQSVCEVCGKQGANQPNAHGWWTTLCPEDRVKAEAAAAEKRRSLKRSE